MLGGIQFRVGDCVPSDITAIARMACACLFFACPLPASSENASAPKAPLCDTSSVTSQGTASQTPPTKFYRHDAARVDPRRGKSIRNIFFATNREINNEELKKSVIDYDKAFDDKQGARTEYGCISISVPQDHKRGKTERPEEYFVPAKDGASSRRVKPLDPSKHFFVIDTEMLDDLRLGESVTRMLLARNAEANSRQAAGHPPADDVLIYIHGLNNTFQYSAIRLAQFSIDTGFDNPALVFSWPAKSNSFNQPQSAGHSYGNFNDALSSLFQYTSANFNLLGHSHGANFVLIPVRNEPDSRIHMS